MRTSPRLLAAAVVALLIGGASGCDRTGTTPDEQTSPQPQPTAEPEPEPEPPKKQVAELIRGDVPTLPAILESVELDMPREAVEKALPQMTEGGILRAEGYEGVFVNLSFDPTSDRLSRVWFSLPGEQARQLLTTAWGEPTVVREYDEKKHVWFAPDARIRAALSEGFGDGLELEFTKYLPARALIGEGAAPGEKAEGEEEKAEGEKAEGEKAEGEEADPPEPPGVPFAFEADRPLLDATLESLREDWSRALQERSAEEAARRLKEIEDITGRKLEPAPDAAPSVHLDLPPTEFGSFFTRVHLDVNADGEVRAYRFSLPFASHPEAAEDLLALLKARLGEPEKTERHGDEVLVFREEGPRVAVRRDEAGHQWDVTVRETGGD